MLRIESTGPAPGARGCASFRATPSDFRAFLRACRRTGLPCARVVASERGWLKSPALGDIAALAVFQDLPPGSSLIASLVSRIVYPAWLRSVPVCFFSTAGEEEYGKCDRLSGLLHTDMGSIERVLAEEQLLTLLDPHMARGAIVVGDDLPSGGDLAPDESLDASQAVAVRHGDGPMRVLAPAGSGKTRTIVSRIGRLVRAGVPPSGILPLAFNRKAAGEMNMRLESKGLGGVHARTFHSLGYEIVRWGSGYLFDAELELSMTREIVGRAITAVHPDYTPEGGTHLDEGVRLLSDVKMTLCDPDRLILGSGGKALPFGPVFRKCLEIQADRRFMNYDDMVYFALNVLLDGRPARRAWQGKWTHVLVDEFQDLNASQLLLLRILSLPRNNLFVVGDDDQAIYGWRGGSVRGLIDFRLAYPSAASCILSTNYRSSERIVIHAGWLIARNRDRVPKTVMVREDAPRGEFRVQLGLGLREQADSAARWIGEEIHASSLRLSDIAVLFRYNALAFVVAVALDARGIPHDCGDAGPLFSSRAGQDVMAWLRYILGRPEPGDIARILSRPKRRVPYAVASCIREEADLSRLVRSQGAGGPLASDLLQFEESCTRLRSLVGSVGARDFLDALDISAEFRSPRRRSREPGRNPDEADETTCFEVIASLASGYPTVEAFLDYAGDALRAPPVRAPEADPRDAVVLSTVHRAKGNEYSHVVFFDVSRRRRLAPEEVEEERRVAYVGLTRARNALLITANARRQSPFLRESALNPDYGSRMRADMESELRSLRWRYTRLHARQNGSLSRSGADAGALRRRIDALEDELLCRSELSMLPP